MQQLPWQVDTVSVGAGRTIVQAVVVSVDQGINLYIGGGEDPHIGTVIICEPRPSLRNDGTYSCTTSVHNFLGHKDDLLAKPIAEALCKQLRKPVVITAGIHVDDATDEELEAFLASIPLLTDKLISRLS
ncbi:hypothetical protein E0485_13020 [Paenibacillus albiflavus]|uniref:Prenylated flavin chaperone LpdD-like domain-containing protein n=1 Tax=Paenibacillus albiflavus TaxID=2545760 RepID=A0A4R4EC38_9BACL|nr:hypothetical protein [Paenibacillus albiflavus]TCZ76520.1 hypothetical protein E0485_13020 [Paenibacillus albiflavus]